MKTAILNVTNFVKKHDNIFAILLFFLATFGIALDVGIASSDEIWNFQNAYKLYNGFQIYKDINIIVTPLFFWGSNIIFKIVGANLLGFRIYHILIMINFYFITYLLLKELKISKRVSIIITLIFMTFEKYNLLLVEANYNIMALLFCLLGVLLLLRKYKYNWALQGIILFLIFATKQNIAAYYLLGLIIYSIINNSKIKDKIKNISKQLAIFLVCIFMLFIYFYYNNILYDFFNFAIFGIQEFANKNISVDISKAIVILFLIFINLLLSICFIKNKKVNSEEKNKILILESISCPLICFAFPILNEVHFLLGSYLSAILFIYQIKILINNIGFKIKLNIIRTINIIFVSYVIFFSVNNFMMWKNNLKELGMSKDSPFYGGLMEKDKKESMNNVLKYIKSNSKRVVILSGKAALYTPILNQNNGIFDLPFKGNLGKDGENGLIEKIKNLHNTEFLIERSKDDLIYQESLLAREYIINNMEKIGEIEEFDIYMKK